MGMFDTLKGIATFSPDAFSGGAQQSMDQGYNRAEQYLNPYLQGGQQDYNSLRDYAGNQGKMLGGYGNPMDQRWKDAGMSPNAYYDKIMGGYNESPDAKYAQEQAMRAANQGASASGMLGSGAYYKGLQENANNISQRDRQQYYGNVMGADQAQQGYAQNFQGQQLQQQQLMQLLASMGYNSANTMAGNSIQQGHDRAAQDRQNSNDWMGAISMGAKAFGGGM